MDADDTSLRVVTEWGLRQAVHLSPSRHHVLLYLCASAFLTDTNPENAYAGQVYRARSTFAAIRKHTGYSERTVRDALRDLQEAAYVLTDMKPGVGKSRILVLWDDKHEALRDDLRAGVKTLPTYLRRAQKGEKTAPVQQEDAIILQFPYRQ